MVGPQKKRNRTCLWVKETGEPVASRASVVEPCPVLLVPRDEGAEPKTQGWQDPRKFVAGDGEGP